MTSLFPVFSHGNGNSACRLFSITMKRVKLDNCNIQTHYTPKIEATGKNRAVEKTEPAHKRSSKWEAKDGLNKHFVALDPQNRTGQNG